MRAVWNSEDSSETIKSGDINSQHLNTKIQEPIPFSQGSWTTLGCGLHHDKKSCQLKALGQLQPFHSRVTCFNVQFLTSSCCLLQIWGTTLSFSPFRLKKNKPFVLDRVDFRGDKQKGMIWVLKNLWNSLTFDVSKGEAWALSWKSMSLNVVYREKTGRVMIPNLSTLP